MLPGHLSVPGGFYYEGRPHVWELSGCAKALSAEAWETLSRAQHIQHRALQTTLQSLSDAGESRDPGAFMPQGKPERTRTLLPPGLARAQQPGTPV